MNTSVETRPRAVVEKWVRAMDRHDLEEVVLRAELRGTAVDGDTVWMEWRMYGTRATGTRFEFAGVNIFGIENDRIAWGRIYTELVRDAEDIDEQVERMTKG